jgi:hypothetical protein
MEHGWFSAMRDGWVWLLAGLGISAAPHQFLGGIILAVAAGILARHWTPIEKRRELVLIIGTSVFCGVAAALAVQWFRPDWPLQPCMALAGLFSTYAMKFTLGVAGKVETKTETVADRIIDRVLPEKDQTP